MLDDYVTLCSEGAQAASGGLPCDIRALTKAGSDAGARDMVQGAQTRSGSWQASSGRGTWTNRTYTGMRGIQRLCSLQLLCAIKPFSSLQPSTVFNTVRSSTCVRPVLVIVRYSIEFRQCSTLFDLELCSASVHPGGWIQSGGEDDLLPDCLDPMSTCHKSYSMLLDEENQNDEDDDEDAHMVEPVREAAPSTTDPSTIPSSSSFSMKEYFANLSKQIEDMSLANQTRFDDQVEMH
ncbi:hypothetical protein LR48_Vigan02g106400 [Vigna angularis]|uniref:Uncharacterized protein n=1 Tax=Phaseolus angularis TaxID=3914 RepID=A0A0L9TXL0_PHAAN|nr:hypothetical protein LR48_Vigan02g106400 [Vigna angularis]